MSSQRSAKLASLFLFLHSSTKVVVVVGGGGGGAKCSTFSDGQLSNHLYKLTKEISIACWLRVYS